MSDKVEIRQALARGYCTERNDHKILDSFLIEDMASEVEKVYESKLAEKDKEITTLKAELDRRPDFNKRSHDVEDLYKD